MNELIKITNHNGKKVVSARELYCFLEATERFSAWFERQIQYGLIENIDYVGCKEFNALANQELMDYALTIDCAKEISMLQRTDKGKQARLYFIERDKQLLEIEKNKSLDTLTHPTRKQLAQWVIEQEEKIEKLEIENKDKSQQLSLAAPKILFADSVNAAQNSILVADLAKLLKQKGIDIGEKRLYEWLRQNGYLCSKGQYRNTPTQKAMELGLFEVLERSMIDRKHDSVFVALTTKITGKGQIYFINKFLRVNAA